MKYVIREMVCGCGIFPDYNNGVCQPIIVLNSRDNAVKVRDILNIDAERKEYRHVLEAAFDLMSIVLCTSARDDLKCQLGKYAWRGDVKNFFIEQAKKEIGSE